ncbi:hypothetical protein PR048_006422 [Dryococelus australis]|uniref:Uncharacterized protein n=1 Tax=Dryococelus australis TaxID=614101 RepID=A0ABQ9IB07_9NEOP|nr:hypothetical protein PR048_006422 [Dryococelus australis]
MKAAWRNILSEWKTSKLVLKETVLKKKHFPFLLKILMDTLAPNSAENLKWGFRKCGNHPINVQELLCRLPSRKCDQGIVQDSFIEALHDKISEWSTYSQSSRGRKNVQVTPAQSVTGVMSIHLGTKKQTSKKLTYERCSEEEGGRYSLKDSSDEDNF